MTTEEFSLDTRIENFDALVVQKLASSKHALIRQLAEVITEAEYLFDKQKSVIAQMSHWAMKAMGVLGPLPDSGNGAVDYACKELSEFVTALRETDLTAALDSIDWKKGHPLKVFATPNWAARWLGMEMTRLLEKDGGGHWNYVTMMLGDGRNSHEVTVQRVGGLTPNQLKDRAEEKLKETHRLLMRFRDVANMHSRSGLTEITQEVRTYLEKEGL
jgi:hypothetical protein